MTRHGFKYPTSCLTCSKSIETPAQTKYRIRKEIAIGVSSLVGCFCSKDCSAKWKQFEAGRTHKCYKCNQKLGWYRGNNPVCEGCRTRAKYEDRTCEQCGNVFQRYVNDNTSGRFCTKACWSAYGREKSLRYTCNTCGIQFPQRGGNRKGLYCSRQCSGVAKRIHEDRRKYTPRTDIERLNISAIKWEKAWAKERRCVCGLTPTHGRYCEACRTEKNLHYKRVQNQRYGNFHRSGVKESIILRDKSVCQYCGVNCCGYETIDHMQPVTRGGSNATDNLVVSCKVCNSIKCNRLPLELFAYHKWQWWNNRKDKH